MPRIFAHAMSAVAVAVLVAAGLPGCSDDGPSDDAAGDDPAATDGTGTDPVAVAAAPSSGCASPAEVAAEAGPDGHERVILASGGQERWYLRRLPPAHDASSPVPVVLDLHGYSEGAEVHVVMSDLGTFGDTAGFVTITPQGQGPVPRWDVDLDGADVAFVGDLLDEVEATLCVDTNRVYVTGLSNGAFLTSAVACRYAARVAAVAPVAGVRDIDGCDPDRPVPVVAFHGTDDEFVTFDGSLGEAVADLPAPDGSGRTLGDLQEEGDPGLDADAGPPPPTVPEIVAAWADRNGCQGDPASEPVADDVTVERYDCPAGASTELVRIEGGGHSWPGSELSAAVADIVGHTTMSISANEVMWAFFQGHPLTPDDA